MVAEVLPAYFIHEAGLGHSLHGLLVDVGEYHLDVMPVAALDDTHEGFDSRSIDGGNISHSYTENIDVLIAEDVFVLVRRSKEHRTVYLEYTGIPGDLLEEDVVGVGVLVVHIHPCVILRRMLSGSVSSSSTSTHA